MSIKTPTGSSFHHRVPPTIHLPCLQGVRYCLGTSPNSWPPKELRDVWIWHVTYLQDRGTFVTGVSATLKLTKKIPQELLKKNFIEIFLTDKLLPSIFFLPVFWPSHKYRICCQTTQTVVLNSERTKNMYEILESTWLLPNVMFMSFVDLQEWQATVYFFGDNNFGKTLYFVVLHKLVQTL